MTSVEEMLTKRRRDGDGDGVVFDGDKKKELSCKNKTGKA